MNVHCSLRLRSLLYFLTLVFFVPLIGYSQDVTITGTVTDQTTKVGMPEVSVTLKGTSVGTTTNGSGSYSINVPANGGTLVFTMIGYGSQEIAIAGKTVINVAMSTASNNMDEVVVIGYGTASKRKLTGAVSSIKATQLENENPSTVQDVLRGNVSGVQVSSSTSAKGGGDLTVRGRTSINAGYSPLIVLDGVIYQGQLADINPNDIATIDVLKDASSAAVFGAKAAAGVVLVTTKRGSGSKPTIALNSNIGFVDLAMNEPLYDGPGFIRWRTDVQESRFVTTRKPYQFDDPRTLPSDLPIADWLKYDNSTGDPVDVWLNRLGLKPIEIENYKKGKTIDWYDMMFQRGLRQDHTLSVSGKKEDFTYYMSLGYTDNEGVIVGDRFKTFRMRVNLEAKVAKFLNVGLNMQFADRDESQVPVNWGQMVNASPYGEIYDADGITLRESPNDDLGNNANPFNDNVYVNRLQKNNTFFGTLYAKGNLGWGFTYQVNFTPNFDFYRYFNGVSAKHPTYRVRRGVATRTTQTTYNWQIDNILNWDKTFGEHQFNATFLLNAEKFQSWREQMDNEGFDPSDVLSYHNMGAGIKPILSTDDQKSTGDALMGRLNYTFKGRYNLQGIVRRDGYSAFGLQNPRGTFGSVGVAWTFSEEKFFPASNWFSHGKIRASYGTNGNRDIGRYTALSDLTSGKYQYISPAGVIVPVSQLWVNRMQNDQLQWEKTAATNFGIDLGFLNNRLTASIDVYDKQTKDLLILRALPTMAGFDNVMFNLGGVENRGMEITINSTNVQSKNLVWRTSFNFWLNRNKIKRLYGPVNVYDANGNVTGTREYDDINNKWFLGRDIAVVWDQRVLGVWQESEKADAARYGVFPGDFKVEDVNNDGKYTNDDRQFLGYTTPRYNWNLRNEFNIYKNFDFSFMMYAVWGQMASYNQAKNNSGFQDRQNSYILPYWTPDNPINDAARLYSSNGGANFSVYRKQSFIRLSTVALSYNVPRAIIQKAKFQSVRIYANVNNAGIYQPDWTFWDAEYGNTPPPRTYTLGINVTL